MFLEKEAAAPPAHARSGAGNGEMAQIGRAGLLQLLRGTREPRQPGNLSEATAGAVVASTAPPEPATPPLVDPDDRVRRTLVTVTV